MNLKRYFLPLRLWRLMDWFYVGGHKVMWFYCRVNWREMCNSAQSWQTGGRWRSLDIHLILGKPGGKPGGKPVGNLPGLESASGKRENVLASRWQVIGYSFDPVQLHFGKRWMNDMTIENETRVWEEAEEMRESGCSRFPRNWFRVVD